MVTIEHLINMERKAALIAIWEIRGITEELLTIKLLFNINEKERSSFAFVL